MVIGWVEINWAMMEQQLTWMAKSVYVRMGGNKWERELPVTSFARKATFLRKACSRIPALAEFKKDIIALLDDAEGLAQDRNRFTHAVVTSIEANRFKFSFDQLKVDRKGGHTLTEFLFDVREFPKLAARFSRLSTDAMNLSARFVKKLGTLP